jgi:mannose-6-phosphate isomerase-like protein (cupin superfamily)
VSPTESAFDVQAPPVAILRERQPVDLVETGGRAFAVAWPGMGSRHRTMHRIELDAGGRLVPLAHESEAVYFVAEGEGILHDLNAAVERPLSARTMVYVPRRTGYRIEAAAPMLVLGGPCPPDESLYGKGERLAPAEGAGDGPVVAYDADREGVPLPMIGRNVKLVVWPGTGAEIATMNFAVLEPGEQNVPHTHAASDDTIAIISGEGTIDDLTNGDSYGFGAGDVVFVSAGVEHMVKADRGVHIVSAGGPCPPDFGMLKALGLV